MFTPLEYGIVAVYMAIILGIGMWLSRKGSENIDAYFLGGKSLPWWVLGISFMTSNLDLTGTMVIASFFSIVGVKGFLIELRAAQQRIRHRRSGHVRHPEPQDAAVAVDQRGHHPVAHHREVQPSLAHGVEGSRGSGRRSPFSSGPSTWWVSSQPYARGISSTTVCIGISR